MTNQSKKKLKSQYISLEDYANLLLQPTKPYTSSPWEFNEKALTLELYEATASCPRRWLYEVDLERCGTQAQMLDWIMHIAQKPWATDLVVASLVRDLYLFLGPKVCFGPGTSNVRAEVRKHMAEANTLRGRRSRSPSRRSKTHGPERHA